MLTKKDFSDLKKIFATKDDLKRFATKDDLRRFATKDDLKRFATKTDLKKYSTKQDLKQVVNAIVAKMIDMNNETRKELRNDILTFKDEILHEIVKLREDNQMIIAQRQRIEDHEERIEKLERCHA